MQLGSFSIFHVLVDIVFSFLYLYSIHLFFCITLIYKKSKRKYIMLTSIIYFIVATLVHLFINNGVLNFIISIIIIFVLSLSYEEKLVSKLIYTSIFIIFMSLSELVVVNTYSLFMNTTAEEVLKNFNVSLFLYAVSKFLPFIILKIYNITHSRELKRIRSDVSTLLLVQLFFIPIMSITILGVASNLTIYNEQYISITLTISIIIINIIFLNIYEKVNVLAEEKVENIILNNQIDYYLSLYESLKAERNDTLRLRHNIKNDIINIRTLLSENKIDETLSELEKILGYKSTINEIFSGIPIIDAVINYKMQIAKKYDIKIKTGILLDKEIYFNNSDISNILGNALDNAIEACRKNVDENNKSIDLSIYKKQNNIYICISNPYEEEITLKDNFPMSSKRDNEYGIGLKTIEKIVNSKNNIMEIDIKDNVFSLEIILFSSLK